MEKKNIKDKIFVIISLIAYVGITFVITMFHENWRDEAQSFMIAKNLSFIDIFKQLKYEGHPFVFYYVVRIFTLLGFGYRIVNIISWIVMCIVAYIILTKSPFSKLNKILILLTVPFIYQYVAFGRSYCLITLFTILLAYLYNKKEKHPYIYACLVALLMNTHIIMLGFCLMLVITFYIYDLIFKRKELDKKQMRRYLISLTIILVSTILIVLQFCSTLSLNSYAKVDEQKLEVTKIVKGFNNLVTRYYTYSLTNNEYAAIIMTILILATIICMLKYKTYKETIILFGALGYQIVFFILLGQSKMYILMTFWIVYVFYLWTVFNKQREYSGDEKYKTVTAALVSTTCLLSILYGSFGMVYNDLKYEYSCAGSAAKYIEENIENGSVFICVDDTICGSIIPYLAEDYDFYSLTADSYYKYVNWDENRNTGLKIEEYLNRIEKFLENNKQLENIYIIFNIVPESETYKYLMQKQLIEFEYMDAKSYSEYSENYYIYKIIK